MTDNLCWRVLFQSARFQAPLAVKTGAKGLARELKPKYKRPGLPQGAEIGIEMAGGAQGGHDDEEKDKKYVPNEGNEDKSHHHERVRPFSSLLPPLTHCFSLKGSLHAFVPRNARRCLQRPCHNLATPTTSQSMTISKTPRFVQSLKLYVQNNAHLLRVCSPKEKSKEDSRSGGTSSLL